MVSDNPPKIKTTEAYKQAYGALNAAQKTAVDTLEGPLLVVAGPGTGKTQILALRIGSILSRTDAQPGNILCLTYTDAGAVAMRNRLLKFIGPEAYRVQVHTFHSFCNQVIQENQEYFSGYTELHHVTDLEKAQLLRNLIDELDFQNPLKRLKGDMYAEAKQMDSLFSLLKRESWAPSYLLEAIQREYQRIEKDPSNYYKRTGKNYKVGDKKPQFSQRTKQMQRLEAAVQAFEPFQQMMSLAARYDFDDMIHWVKNAFESNEGFKAIYQERFLYLLVDEFQDTNGAQNKIIQLLSDFWEKPNLFVVGDDDQAIFRFQGANISNLTDLYKQYDPSVIVLTDNYRSSQVILDRAASVIKHNSERLGNQIPGIQKILTAKTPISPAPKPEINKYQNVIQEETAVFEKLRKLHKDGVPLNEVAVIYRKHSHASNLVKALSQQGIPLNIKQRVNVLDEPLVQNLKNILTYLASQYENPGNNEALLFEIMHYRFFDLSPVDVAKVSMHCWKRSSQRLLRFAIQDLDMLESLELKDIAAFIRFDGIMTELEKSIPHITLEILFEQLLKKANVFRDIMASEQRTYLMQVVGTLFNHLKAECQRDPTLDLPSFLETLDQMREIGLQLPMHNLIRAKDGINFLTAHGAKGLEFTHVFIIGCNRRNWERIRGGNWSYKLPSEIVDPSTESNDEDERRLFYVALTRAKQHLHLSYAMENLNGMLREPSVFLIELIGTDNLQIKESQPREEDAIGFYHQLLNSKETKLPLIDHDLIDKALERFVMTSTSLNQYLQCPRTFYFQKILRVPLASNPYLGFGNAVHDALQHVIEDQVRGLHPDADRLVELYQTSMMKYRSFFTRRQFDNYVKHGELVLPKYFQDQWTNWLEASELITEKEISHAVHRGVPMKGRLDLIVKQKNGHIKVIDFKTGNNNRNNRREKLKVPASYEEIGGDYWRQMVFYKILLGSHKQAGLHMDIGEVSFVEPDSQNQFNHESFYIDLGQYEMVSDQIVDTYKKMNAHVFDVDCGRDRCSWCSFVKNDFVLPEDTFDQEDDVQEDGDIFVPQQMELGF